MPLTHITHPISRSTWYVLAVIYASMFMMIMANMLYTNYIAQTNARKWCNLLVTMDEAYQQSPPRTDAGRRVSTDIHQLRIDLDCRTKRSAPR